MEQVEQNVVVADTLEGLGKKPLENFLGHALCLDGECGIVFNGVAHTMRKGDLMIVRKGKLVEKIAPDSQFRVMVVYVSAPFIGLSTPQSNYGVKGRLALFLNPIMHLNSLQFEQCIRNFNDLQCRLRQTDHHFYRDLLMNKVQGMILDFFDFHASLYKESDVSTQYAKVMNAFLALLENGEYRQHREVSWYADKLCVTSKYLSEVSKSACGYSANFWINRYTSLEISRLLRDKSLSFVQISDMLNFSSPAYFSRYVLHNLGVNPTEYRG